jgi:GNAT superfamily N-acetyltransferase
MKIVSLSQCPQYSPILAHWAYFQWYNDRTISFKVVDADYRRRSETGSLPVSWVAFDADTPVGMISLKTHDLSSHTHLSPWLSALYVLPLFRRRGIANMLISTVIENAKTLGFSRLYLFADHKNLAYLSRFYEARGWHFEEKAVDGDGNETAVYSFQL